MPESFNKLIESYEELIKENEFLQAKSRYWKQSCLAMDMSLNLANKKIMELKADAKELAS